MKWEGNREFDPAEDRRDGRGVPERSTHGTSAQRTCWFNTGRHNGSVKGCDTFSAKNLQALRRHPLPISHRQLLKS